MPPDEKNDKTLWPFPPGKQDSKGSADYDPRRSIYVLYNNTRNPYLKRALAPTQKKIERNPEELSRLFSLLEKTGSYKIASSNTDDPIKRRSLEYPTPTLDPTSGYKEPQRLPGDFGRLPWLIDIFFASILERLRENPAEFYTVVDELTLILKNNRIQVRMYDAYRTLRDWDHLLETLEEIAKYPSADTYDLFCSALFTYYELVYPPSPDIS